jgi:hypothetical protein
MLSILVALRSPKNGKTLECNSQPLKVGENQNSIEILFQAFRVRFNGKTQSFRYCNSIVVNYRSFRASIINLTISAILCFTTQPNLSISLAGFPRLTARSLGLRNPLSLTTYSRQSNPTNRNAISINYAN